MQPALNTALLHALTKSTMFHVSSRHLRKLRVDPKMEIWLRVQQMMKGSDIGIQEKKAKLFNEWERFTSTDGESIESYYHRFLKLMNDFKRNKHFPEKIASNLKFLNNLQPEKMESACCSRCSSESEWGEIGVQNSGKWKCCSSVGTLREESGIQLQAEDSDLDAALQQILMNMRKSMQNWHFDANLPQATTSGTQTEQPPVYDSDGSSEEGGTVDQHPATVEETRALLQF
ncbi:hypothetical protein Tco_1484472 [Tanacetum coccineum]